MIKRTYLNELNLSKEIYNKYSMDKLIYFDIETTGFNKENDKIILISLGYFKDYNKCIINQYFCEDLMDEKEVLIYLNKEIKNYDAWVSYNGIAFDEPFIKERMYKNAIKFNAPKIHIDIYRIVRPYCKMLGIKRSNLKSVEKFLGIRRNDIIDGGLSVELYDEYLATKNDKLVDIIMLHNYEDVLNLPKLFELIYKIDLDPSMQRKNLITEKQLNYLKYLIKKNNINIYGPKENIEKISKKNASKIINKLVNGEKDDNYINTVICNSF